MRIEQREGSGLRQGRTPAEGRVPFRCAQLQLLACTAKRLNPIERQKGGAGQSQCSRHSGTLTQGLRHAQDTRGDQRPVCYRAEQHHGSHVLAPQTLPQDERILGTDGNDEPQTQGQTLDEWLRSGAVLAAVTGSSRAPAGCNSRPLGSMRYVPAASPEFMARHFAVGVGAGSLARAPSLVFNAKDELQAQWAQRLCHRHVELPRHILPSTQAFVTATLAGMGWGLHPKALIAPHLKDGSLVELVPKSPLDVALHWQHARAASALLDGLTKQLVAAARRALLPS